jgi:hypothetical protein
LEKEEEMRIETGVYDYKVPELSETMKEIQLLAKQIREKKIIMKEESKINKQSTKPVVPRTSTAKTRDRSVSKLRNQMEDLGVDMENTETVILFYIYLYLLYQSTVIISHIVQKPNKNKLLLYRHTLRKRKSEEGHFPKVVIESDNVCYQHL